ncbi:uncharacterized protein LOC115184920 isoform X5 [Salmo trutta]|uniref:uncharacterized protein LOC115184916 isoform X7 n=2 Tax=Salmo trutta TaxID=8032 RepID=UPI0011313599|nr:uncharacterized protein LOC115184916 isoform X7 [Salmo trutta]XP_029601351.1 uncharacterized protein LOC115184920 isoform X5 [Salmo trutta]
MEIHFCKHIPYVLQQQLTYNLTLAGRMLVRELAVLNTQMFMMDQPVLICFTLVGRMVWEELSSQTEQPNSEDSGFPYEKMQLVGNWGSFHFHTWIIRYGRVQQNEEDMHHLCIVRGVEKQLWWSRVIQEKILDPWGIVQVVLTNMEVTGIKFLGRRIHELRSCLVKTRSEFTYYEDAQQVDISTTVEGFQERGDDMMAYQFSTSDIFTIPHEPSSGSSHQFPQDSPPPPPPPPFPSDSPPPYHFTQDQAQDQTPDSTPQEFVEEQHNAADVPQLWSYFGNQGTTNFSLRLAGIRRAMEVRKCEFTTICFSFDVHLCTISKCTVLFSQALTSSDSNSLNYLTHAGRMVLSGLSELNQQINHINFTDVFYEFVLLSLLEGKTSIPTSRPGTFFYLLVEVIMKIHPPGEAWTESAGNFYLLIKDQMKAWLDSIFNLDESIYESPQRLSWQVMVNLEMQVDFLLSSLD